MAGAVSGREGDNGRPVRVVLASQSPRRRELLTLVGIPHEVVPADGGETLAAALAAADAGLYRRRASARPAAVATA